MTESVTLKTGEMIDDDILLKIMEEYVPKTPRYVSCIRINGKPILPPLVNDDYRKELLHYKHLALVVEKKINGKKQTVDNRQSVDSGIIAYSTNEPSWLNPCILQVNNDASTLSVDCDKATNCESVSHSDISENISSKTLICDDDMWRYLSKCSSDQCNSSQVDFHDYDIDSDVPSELKIQDDAISLNSSFCKSILKISSNVEVAKSSIKSIEPDIQICARKEGEQISHDCNIGCCFQNNSFDLNNCHDNNVLNNFKSSKICVENNLPEVSKSKSENDNSKKCSCEKVFDEPVANILEYVTSPAADCRMVAHANVIIDKLDCKLNSKVDTDITTVENGKYLPSKSLSKSVLSTTPDCDVEIGAMRGSKEVSGTLSISCSLSKLGLETCDKNYSAVAPSQHVYCMDNERKIEKYNPLKYSCGEKYIEVKDHDAISGMVNPILKSETEDRRSSGELDIIESDSTCTEPSGVNNQDNSVNLDYISTSQKMSNEIPLSESISISETDCKGFSLATISQDTAEDTSELCNESCMNKSCESDVPKLVRQNSYTLIAPSPILLAHAKASEKLDDRTSEDENSCSSQLKGGRKSWDIGKAKTDSTLGKPCKYVYAVPLKHSSDISKTIGTLPSSLLGDSKPKNNKISSLPESCVSSPIKINPFSSSFDNLPMVNIRKFQEYICSKSNFRESSSQLPPETYISSEHVPGYDSLIHDVDFDKNLKPGKIKTSNNDMPNCEFTDGKIKTNSSSVLSTPKQGSENCFTNVEETFKCSIFSKSSSNFLDHYETTEELTSNDPPPNHSQFQQSCFDSSSVHSQENNNHTKAHQGYSSVQNDFPQNVNPPTIDCTVQSIFLQLQNQHSQLMAQLLDRQKKEQETLANTFLNQQRQILREMKIIPADTSIIKETVSYLDNENLSIEKVPECSHEYLSINSDSRDFHHLKSAEIISPGNNSMKDQSCGTEDALRSSVPSYDQKKLFIYSSFEHKNVNYSEEQIRAATSINAVARGYLVRRLLKTEHVQEIIKTISESVMCALQLQRECPVDITPSDVELHRRLIQQLTAACHSLHETFFSLPLQERMNIIATDREKRNLQSSRPVSAKSSISTATQKYLQRKQQLRSGRQSDRPVSTSRRSWWRSKGRVSSAGNYEQSPSCLSKQPNAMSPKQQQCNNRSARRPWR